jgi:hypothetical protein
MGGVLTCDSILVSNGHAGECGERWVFAWYMNYNIRQLMRVDT